MVSLSDGAVESAKKQSQLGHEEMASADASLSNVAGSVLFCSIERQTPPPHVFGTRSLA